MKMHTIVLNTINVIPILKTISIAKNAVVVKLGLKISISIVIYVLNAMEAKKKICFTYIYAGNIILD
jgi:hypothetical protein